MNDVEITQNNLELVPEVNDQVQEIIRTYGITPQQGLVVFWSYLKWLEVDAQDLGAVGLPSDLNGLSELIGLPKLVLMFWRGSPWFHQIMLSWQEPVLKSQMTTATLKRLSSIITHGKDPIVLNAIDRYLKITGQDTPSGATVNINNNNRISPELVDTIDRIYDR